MVAGSALRHTPTPRSPGGGRPAGSHLLAQVPLFTQIARPVVERIAAAARPLLAERGKCLFARGTPCRGFHLLLAGQVKLCMSSDRGDEKIIEILGPGQSFGEAMMFLGSDYIVSAVTLTPARLLVVPREAIDRELDRDPALMRAFLASLSLRLHRLLTDIEDYSLNTGRQRVIGFLLQHAAHSGEPAAGEQIRLPFSKALLASRLNVTHEHFSRILHQLVDEGLIGVHGNAIQLHDPVRLRASI